MQALADLLLHGTPPAILLVSLLKATLVLGIAQLVVSTVPRMSAAVRHFILTAALSSFVVIPAISFLAPHWRVTIPVKAASAPQVISVGTAAPAQPAIPESRTIAGPLPAETPATGAAPQPRLTIWQIVAITWLGVAVVLLARLARSAARIRGIVRDASEPSARTCELLNEVHWRLGLRSEVRILQSDRIVVPMAWGFRNGTLLLPMVSEEWSDEDLRGTLIHELGHLQRLDYFSLTIINIVSALLWFHPQIWSARRRALAEGERACDDMVVRAGERPSGYASHLLQVARLMPKRDPLTALLAMSRPSQLEGRMYAILSTSVNRQGVGRKLAVAAITVFFAVVVPLSVMQPALEAAVDSSSDPAGLGSLPASGGQTLPGHDRQGRSGSGADRGWIASGERGNTGTCADYITSFGGSEVAFGEERLTIAGNRLQVTAGDAGGVRLRRSSTGEFSVIACKAASGLTSSEATNVVSQISLRERDGALTVIGPEAAQWVAHLIVSVPDGASVAARAVTGLFRSTVSMRP